MSCLGRRFKTACLDEIGAGVRWVHSIITSFIRFHFIELFSRVSALSFSIRWVNPESLRLTTLRARWKLGVLW